MLENLYLNAAVFGVLGFGAALAAGMLYKKKRSPENVKLWTVAVLFGLFIAALAYVISLNRGEEPVYVPFLQWLRVREIGYKAVWMSFFRTLVPFTIAGFFLAPAFPKTNTLRRAALWALGAAAVTAVGTLVIHGFNSDAVIGAFLGVLCGFGLFAFFKLFFPKAKFFKNPVMKRKTHIGSLAVVFVVYFACVGLIVVDSGGEFEKLNIFSPDTQLPQDMTCEVELSGEREKMLTYSTVAADPKNDAERIAHSFGMDVSGLEADAENKRATVVDGQATLTVNLTGEWKYTLDGFVAQAGASVQESAFYEEKALALVQVIELPFDDYRVGDVGFSNKKDAAGEMAPAVVVHLVAYPGGYSVQGSCEVTVTFWYDGTLYSVDKYSSDFESYKEVTIISQQEAWEMIQNGEAAHTLWNPAESARVISVEKAYWLEEIKGYLHPIWLFRAVAVAQDGTETQFNIFVPAMDY